MNEEKERRERREYGKVKKDNTMGRTRDQISRRSEFQS